MKTKILLLSVFAIIGVASLTSLEAKETKLLFVESDNIALAGEDTEPRWGCRVQTNWTCADGLILIYPARYDKLAPWED